MPPFEPIQKQKLIHDLCALTRSIDLDELEKAVLEWLAEDQAEGRARVEAGTQFHGALFVRMPR
jgi:hypothetical protein